MALCKELCGILALGAQQERASRNLYLQAAAKTKHPLGKKIFEQLAAEETNHDRLLQDWVSLGVCPVEVTLPTINRNFVRGMAAVAERVKADTNDLAAIQIAQDMERKSIEFYNDCAAKVPDGASRDLFRRLRGEEDTHLALLIDLYDYLVNPELWSVRDQRSNFDS